MKPCCAVEQNVQSMVQPTWLEMHSVPRPGSGMNTISMAWPLSSRSSHLRVPSAERCETMTSGDADLRHRGEALAEILAEVGHRVDVADGAPVHPLHELPGAKRLLAHADDERLQPGLVRPSRLVFGVASSPMIA